MTDNVNHPKHYLSAALTLEPIELTARLNSCLGQALQYVCRAPYKGNEIEDLEKAVFYLNKQFEIEPFFKVSFEATPYIQIFMKHTEGLFGSVLKSLFTCARVKNDIQEDHDFTYFFVNECNLREAKELICRRLRYLGVADA